MLLENESFLSELTKLFQSGRTSGSVCITMKRYDGRTKPRPRASKLTQPLPPPSEFKCLFRATLGNKKISTVVNARDINKFQMAYSNVLKGNMDNLKKKGKKSGIKATC
ncbi:signal recognition particle 14 kDa protein-like [Centruroides sculpturatus]|uniref:signal recognition particle 14 kDa protein-like n=1 Tax=Centruroides sculpturatus TaxID=218467 RepID=UPI000C6DE6D2|nr:signal recognition particle 14 kDa protein-like [Centruroides sculpturatus]